MVMLVRRAINRLDFALVLGGMVNRVGLTARGLGVLVSHLLGAADVVRII